MLDPRFVRGNIEVVKKALTQRRSDVDIDNYVKLQSEYLELLAKAEELRRERNETSKQIGQKAREKKPATDEMARMKQVSGELTDIDDKIGELEKSITYIARIIPNIPHSSVPVGASEADNPVLRTWGTPREFSFTPKNHWDIDEAVRRADELAQEIRARKPKVADWIEGGIGDCLAVFSFPKGHRTRLRTTNMVERLNKEIKRRTSVIEIFPSEQSAERIIGALLIDQDERWQVGRTYLNMDELKEWESKQSGEQAEELEFAEAS